MINNVTLKIQTNNEIIWSVLLLIVLRMLKFDDQLIVGLAIVYIILISLKAKRFFVPRVGGLKVYAAMLVITMFYGLVQYETRDWMKSIFYAGGSLVLIYLAFVIQSKYENKSIIKTLYLGGVLIVLQSLFVFVKNISQMVNIDSIRQYEGDFVYEISAIFIVFFIEKVFYKKVIFGKVLDYVILILYIAKIALSLSRSGIGQFAIEVVVSIICIMLVDPRRIKVRTLIIMIALSAVFFAVFSSLPEDSVNAFNEKVDNTSEEINYNQEFNSVKDAMHNWRAYEIYEAKRQWKSNNGFELLFGEGMGSAVRARFIPVNWGEGMIVDNKLPLLHNGYYTMLILGGLFGVFAILTVFLSPILLLIKNRNRKDLLPILISAVATSIAMIFCTYVVNGIVTRTVFFNWCMIYGCAYGMVAKERTEGEVENSESK